MKLKRGLRRSSDTNSSSVWKPRGQLHSLTAGAVCLIALSFFVCPCHAAYAPPSITMVEPNGSGDRVNAGNDFATEKIGDPWDMDQTTDCHYYIVDFANSGFLTQNGDTLWQGTSLATSNTGDNPSTSDCSVMLHFPGAEAAQNVGRNGVAIPINADTYRYLSYRVNVEKDSSTQVVWYNDTVGEVPEQGDASPSVFFPVYQGWRVYTVDLAQLDTINGPAWSGTKNGIRLDPTNLKEVDVSLDWVRLHAADSAATRKTVTWNHTDPNGHAVVSLFADRDRTAGRGFSPFYQVIATGLDASSGSYTWGTAHLPPEDLYIYALIGENYPAVILNDPWDMSQPADLETYGAFSNTAFSNGIFSGTTTGTDSYITMHIDDRYPASASTFRVLSFRMYLGQAGNYQVHFKRAGSSANHSTVLHAGQQGWAEYTLNMTAESSQWSGSITDLRIDPTSNAGVAVKFDWVTLTTPGSSTTGQQTTFGDYSSGAIGINDTPLINITAPGMESGEDWAQAVLHDTWDMAQSTDLTRYDNLSNVSFGAGAGMTGTSTSSDSQMYFVEFDSPAIDAEHYTNLSFDLKLLDPIADPAKQGSDIFRYDVLRVFWRPSIHDHETCAESIVLFFGYTSQGGKRSQDQSGWIRYNLHLPTAVIVEDIPDFSTVPWGGTENWFRIDASEYGGPSGGRRYGIRNVSLTADEESFGEYVIRWDDSDLDDNAEIRFYYDNNKSGYNGILINTTQPVNEDAGGTTGSYLWETGGIDEGSYYIYAVIDDGRNIHRVYSERPLYIHWSEPPDQNPPELADQYPPPGSVGASPYTVVSTHVRDDSAGVNPASIAMTVKFVTVNPEISGGGRDYLLTYRPASQFQYSETVNVGVTAEDLSSERREMDESYSFTTTSSRDSDGDGLPDEWETMNGLDPGSADGKDGSDGDADGDGQSNEDEFYNGTDPTTPVLIVAGPGAGPDCPPSARGFYRDGTPLDGFEITAYGVEAWGCNVASGDLDGDGVEELLTGPGPGRQFGPHVRGWRYVDDTMTPMSGLSFLAYGTNKYGVNVAGGDIDGDGMDEIITGAGPGRVFGPHVRGWNYDGGEKQPIGGVSYFAYGTNKYGVNVTCGDVDGDGIDEIITGPGPGAVFGPHVRGWNYDNQSVRAMPSISFMAYGTYKYGVNVCCGDIDGDGIDEIVTGAGPGTVFGPHVRGFNIDGGQSAPIPQVSFFAFDTTKWGVNVTCGDVDGDGIDEIVTGPGPGEDIYAQVRAFDWDGSGSVVAIHETDFMAYPANVTYGTKVTTIRFED